LENVKTTDADGSGIIGPGIQIYLSPTVPGRFTQTKPSAPNHLVYVGVITRASTGVNLDGRILVGIQNGYELHELHDVAISSPAAKQVVKRNAGNTLWVNEAIVSADVSDATSAATANRIVIRDGSGNFSAGTITASLTGTASDVNPAGTSIAAALSGKQPLDADLTAIAALTTTANGRTLLTSANALTIGASASVSGTNTGDQTNITGNAGTVTSIGNLTGVVTSVNRATTIADGALSIAKTSGLQTALDGKQPLDADLTSWASVTRASGFDTFTATPSSANLEALVTDETGTGALVFATGPTFVGLTNTGALNLATGTTFTYGTGIAASHRTALGLGSLATQSGTIADYLTIASASATYLPRLSTLTVTGTTPTFSDSLVEQPDLFNGRRWWESSDGYLLFDGSDWQLSCFDGLDTYSASLLDSTHEPWKIASAAWNIISGTGEPTLEVSPTALVPVNTVTGTIALAADQQGRVSPPDMTGLGSGVAGALSFASNANGGFLTAGTGGTLPLTRGGTGSTTASNARIALGGVDDSSTGTALFGAATAAAANTILANNIVTKADNFTLAQTDAGTYMRLTKTGSTTQSLAFAGSATVNGTANLASVPTNGAFALKHISSGTYDFI